MVKSYPASTSRAQSEIKVKTFTGDVMIRKGEGTVNPAMK